MSAPVAAMSLRERLADRLTGGELTRLRAQVAADPDRQSRITLGAVLARARVHGPTASIEVPSRVLAHWQQQYLGRQR